MNNVTFHEGDPAELGPAMGSTARSTRSRGRYVLMFQRDPVPMLRALAARLVPGGILVFHEPDWQAMHSNPPSPTYDRCRDWMVGLLRATGTESRMGVKLHAAYVAAGLPAPTMGLEAGIGGAQTGIEWIRLLTELIETVVPELEKHGLATAGEVDAPTLADRIVTELRAHDGAIVGRGEVGRVDAAGARMIEPAPSRSRATACASSRSRPRIAAGLAAAAADGALWELWFTRRAARPRRRPRTSPTRSRARRPGTCCRGRCASSRRGTIVGSTRYHDIVRRDRPRRDRLHVVRAALAAHAREHGLQAAAARHAFETLGCQVVGLRTDNFNFASQRAIEALGAKKDGVIRHHAARRDGTVARHRACTASSRPSGRT